MAQGSGGGIPKPVLYIGGGCLLLFAILIIAVPLLLSSVFRDAYAARYANVPGRVDAIDDGCIILKWSQQGGRRRNTEMVGDFGDCNAVRARFATVDRSDGRGYGVADIRRVTYSFTSPVDQQQRNGQFYVQPPAEDGWVVVRYNATRSVGRGVALRAPQPGMFDPWEPAVGTSVSVTASRTDPDDFTPDT